MKVEQKVIFTEEEEKVVAKVVKMLEELIGEYNIFNVHAKYNFAENVALDELLEMMDNFQKFVDYSCEWEIDD